MSISVPFVGLLKLPILAVVVMLTFVIFILVIRKLAYQLYRYFPNASRVYQAQSSRDLLFYWRDRADFSFSQLTRLYFLLILGRFDKYFPVFDCDRQAAKAQHSYDHRWTHGIGRFRHHYINPKSWPVLLVRWLLWLLDQDRKC